MPRPARLENAILQAGGYLMEVAGEAPCQILPGQDAIPSNIKPAGKEIVITLDPAAAAPGQEIGSRQTEGADNALPAADMFPEVRFIRIGEGQQEEGGARDEEWNASFHEKGSVLPLGGRSNCQDGLLVMDRAAARKKERLSVRPPGASPRDGFSNTAYPALQLVRWSPSFHRLRPGKGPGAVEDLIPRATEAAGAVPAGGDRQVEFPPPLYFLPGAEPNACRRNFPGSPGLRSLRGPHSSTNR